MNHKLNALAAALALAASVGAHATVQNSNQNLGNSTVYFLAIDNAHTTSITIDLGINMADFLQASPAGASITNNDGALAGAGTTAVWNFASNAYTLNGGATVTDGNVWADAFASFTSAIGSNPYKWAVVAADNVTGAITASNLVQNRNLLSTGAPTQANINNVTGSSTVSNGTGIFQNWAAATSSAGNHPSVTNGANVETSGGAFIWSAMQERFGTVNIGWSYLVNVGSSSGLFMTQQWGNPIVYQIGSEYGIDTLLDADKAATFSFNGSTLTYAVPVPEPGSYALLIAGLAALGLLAYRRQRG